MKRVFVAVATLLCMGCNDDSAIRAEGCSACTGNQVCSGAGICYDNPSCAACGKGQVCVGGSCYDDGDACAKCEAEQVCFDSKCYAASSPCVKCKPSQVCKDSKCYDANDPCLSCGKDQVCVGSACYDKEDACAKCEASQICVNHACFDSDDPCAKCTKGQICVQKQCYDESDDCVPACAGDKKCIDGACVDCTVMCSGECCGAGELCDLVENTCGQSCGDVAACKGNCCFPSEICHPTYGCIEDCGEQRTMCVDENNMRVSCCEAGMICEAGACKEDCKGGVRCNNACCSVGDVCEDNACKIPCNAETHTRCGGSEEYCCENASQVCISNVCIAKGKTCAKASDCDFDEICDESFHNCIKVDDIPLTCEVRPEKGKFAPILQWHWPEDLPNHKSAFHPEYNQVMMTPIVLNMTDDNGDGVIDENDIPDVMFSTFTSWKYDYEGVVRAISGDDGRELAATEPIYSSRDDFGAADIDGDGVPELIVHTKTEIHALSLAKDDTSPTGYQWVVKYRLAHGLSIKPENMGNLQATFAHMDDDGIVDIVTQRGVLNVVNGELVWKEGCKQKGLGNFPFAVDLDGDGTMEIVTSGAVYDNHCRQLVAHGFGNPTVADMMPSGPDAAETGELIPEIAGVSGGAFEGTFRFTKLYKKDDKWSAKTVWTAPIPINYERTNKDAHVDCRVEKAKYDADHGYKYNNNCNSGGGPPVIADFDGDGRPDIGVAARWYYIVYSNDGTPTGGKVLWADGKTQDFSSAVTGSSVFDFEGDGSAEVVYADEVNLRVYAGKGSGVDANNDTYFDPVELYRMPNSSGTLYEYPIIVDVDNDGSTEIVVASNDYSTKTVTGVRAFEDPGRQWVRTRRVWNQHHYHVTNINEDGSVPLKETMNWLHPKLNNWRQNVQPSGVFNAPNLVAEGLVSDLSACGEVKSVTLTARVSNQGSLGIKAGLSVKFYYVDKNDATKKYAIGTAKVAKNIAPGQQATASIVWDQTIEIDGVKQEIDTPAMLYIVVDEPTADKPYGEFVECNDDDNALAPQLIELCPNKVN